jgi:hypothetical protein
MSNQVRKSRHRSALGPAVRRLRKMLWEIDYFKFDYTCPDCKSEFVWSEVKKSENCMPLRKCPVCNSRLAPEVPRHMLRMWTLRRRELR